MVPFQSTHPLRGATGSLLAMRPDCQISIHAPLAGCDQAGHGARIVLADDFNPRTPCGVRLPPRGHPQSCSNISIHAPLAGCDNFESHTILSACLFQSTHPLRGATETIWESGLTQRISIHAPLAGCDIPAYLSGRVPEHFNPRTPCGVRRGGADRRAKRHEFQSTHPLRGATAAEIMADEAVLFQSTHPLRGATQPKITGGQRYDISIHAPLAGCDADVPSCGQSG